MEANPTTTATTTTTRQSQDAGQLLTFFVANEEYGVDILRVQEIRGWTAPMPVPNSPSYIEGVINIRGDIVPIADLRERLGLPRLPGGPTTAVVVLRVAQKGRQRVMGIIVDAMSDVTNIPQDSLKPAPDFGDAASGALTKGIATVGDKMITILNVDEIFATAAALEAA